MPIGRRQLRHVPTVSKESHKQVSKETHEHHPCAADAHRPPHTPKQTQTQANTNTDTSTHRHRHRHTDTQTHGHANTDSGTDTGTDTDERERPGSEFVHLTLRTDGERDDVECSSPCLACTRALHPSSLPSRLLSHRACRQEATEPLRQRDLACVCVYVCVSCVCVWALALCKTTRELVSNETFE